MVLKGQSPSGWAFQLAVEQRKSVECSWLILDNSCWPAPLRLFYLEAFMER